jgi:hypothetical protein
VIFIVGFNDFVLSIFLLKSEVSWENTTNNYQLMMVDMYDITAKKLVSNPWEWWFFLLVKQDRFLLIYKESILLCGYGRHIQWYPNRYLSNIYILGGPMISLDSNVLMISIYCLYGCLASNKHHWGVPCCLLRGISHGKPHQCLRRTAFTSTGKHPIFVRLNAYVKTCIYIYTKIKTCFLS